MNTAQETLALLKLSGVEVYYDEFGSWLYHPPTKMCYRPGYHDWVVYGSHITGIRPSRISDDQVATMLRDRLDILDRVGKNVVMLVQVWATSGAPLP